MVFFIFKKVKFCYVFLVGVRKAFSKILNALCKIGQIELTRLKQIGGKPKFSFWKRIESILDQIFIIVSLSLI